MGQVNEVDFVQLIGNGLLTLVTGVLEVGVQVTHDNWNTAIRAGMPRRPKCIHPHNIVGGDVDPHHIKPFVPRDKLEGQEVGGGYASCLHLERTMTFLPNEGNLSLFVACRLQQDDFEPRYKLGISIICDLHLHQNGSSESHLHQPFSRRCQSKVLTAPNIPGCNQKSPAIP